MVSECVWEEISPPLLASPDCHTVPMSHPASILVFLMILRSHPKVTYCHGHILAWSRGLQRCPFLSPAAQGIEVSRSQPASILVFLVILRSHPKVTYWHSHILAWS